MSSKSTAEKLLIKPNTTVWSLDGAGLPLLEPWPKGVRAVNRTDINRDSLWPILSEYRMRQTSQVALDAVGCPGADVENSKPAPIYG